VLYALAMGGNFFARIKANAIAQPRRGGCASNKKSRSTVDGADGVVGSSHRLSVVEQTTPAAPSKEGDNLFGGASTPPWLSNGIRFNSSEKVSSYRESVKH